MAPNTNQIKTETKSKYILNDMNIWKIYSCVQFPFFELSILWTNIGNDVYFQLLQWFLYFFICSFIYHGMGHGEESKFSVIMEVFRTP